MIRIEGGLPENSDNIPAHSSGSAAEASDHIADSSKPEVPIMHRIMGSWPMGWLMVWFSLRSKKGDDSISTLHYNVDRPAGDFVIVKVLISTPIPCGSGWRMRSWRVAIRQGFRKKMGGLASGEDGISPIPCGSGLENGPNVGMSNGVSECMLDRYSRTLQDAHQIA